MEKKYLAITIISVIILSISSILLYIMLNQGEVKQEIPEEVNNEKYDGSYNDTKGVNSPKITEGMIPVYWNKNGEEILFDSDAFVYNDWYDYASNKWANAKTSDGSYWVWIPRYAYSIEKGYHEQNSGEIKIEFLKDLSILSSKEDLFLTNELGKGNWNIHPAFSYYEDGKNHQLNGIWVSKYEIGYENTNEANLNMNTVFSKDMKMVSKGNVPIWNAISIDNAYVNGLLYDNIKRSHLIKNSEWSAIVYLQYSLGITENMFSVSGMNNGVQEYVAAFLETGVLDHSTELIIAGSAYVDKYTSYDQHYGDAIFEVSSKKSGATTWNNGESEFMTSEKSFLTRGGTEEDNSIFSFSSCSGLANENRGYRIVLW